MSKFLSPIPDVCNAYFELHNRLSELIEHQPESAASTVVPHCPNWTVHHVLSHMIGVPEDILSGAMDGVATNAWTQRQVDRHASHSLQDLLEIWKTVLEMFKNVLPNIPQPVVSQFLFDQATHEQDIRHALSAPGARESSAMVVAEGFLRDYLSRNSDPSISNLAESPLTGFDFVRALSGRRTTEQITDLGLPAERVAAFIATAPFDLPTATVIE